MSIDSASAESRTGKVYLVGAGPGHPELLTVKAAELLKICDVVVYDRLIQEEALALVKPSAERIYMGKPLGRHDSRQDEIHRLLAGKARENKIVVRLKGGDPFLFGRGGEEAEYLAEHGVPFEIIPGVTSALAAPACAGIPVTHRDWASSVTVVTGHEAGPNRDRIQWGALARIDTLVFLMAVRSVGRIAQQLIAHGRDPRTPAAMIQSAFWASERVVAGTLETIAAEVERAGLDPPATLVIGEVVRLRQKFIQSRRDLARQRLPRQPAPAPDQLLQLATAGLGTQALRLALLLELFDQLEEFTSVSEIALSRGLNTFALDEILQVLVSLGLLEYGPDGYRNLELASAYLRTGSPGTLRPALLYLAAQSEPADQLARYALNGCRDAATNGNEELFRQACESLARFAAPRVAEKLNLARRRRLQVIGWGGDAYRAALRRRWPALEIEASNPWQTHSPPADLVRPGSCDAILFSSLLAFSRRGQIQRALEAAAAIRPGGLLALHDAFAPAGVPPSAAMTLATLGRHVVRGGCRAWSVERAAKAMEALGFSGVEPTLLSGGTVLITANKRG
ncbi:MAG: uroporphyrinogen-III C-methyltransferase [Bryobacteraceae bacterium]|nr:uroporphyrinogen-III C-methyltransferase [Bryobacteraceae bacterium]